MVRAGAWSDFLHGKEITVCKIVLVIYCLLYAFALTIFIVGVFGWFGAERDPLSGVYLIILGQPWTRWVDLLPERLWPAGAALAPAVNASIILALCRLLRARGS